MACISFVTLDGKSIGPKIYPKSYKWTSPFHYIYYPSRPFNTLDPDGARRLFSHTVSADNIDTLASTDLLYRGEGMPRRAIQRLTAFAWSIS